MFIRMLLFTILTLVIQIVLNLVAVTSKEEIDSYLLTFGELIVLNYVTLGLSVVCLGFLFYLLCYHEYLMRNNLTTFKKLQLE